MICPDCGIEHQKGARCIKCSVKHACDNSPSQLIRKQWGSPARYIRGKKCKCGFPIKTHLISRKMVKCPACNNVYPSSCLEKIRIDRAKYSLWISMFVKQGHRPI